METNDTSTQETTNRVYLKDLEKSPLIGFYLGSTKKPFDFNHAVKSMHDFLDRICHDPCYDILSGSGRKQNCRCLEPLMEDDSLKAVTSTFLVHFARNDWKHRENIITETMRYANALQVAGVKKAMSGETYYYSPLNVYCFGVVDCSTKPETMSTHLYYEGQGKKGGDNVVSLIWKELKGKGLIPESGPSLQPVKEINFVFDNCGGQDKNRMVLRMLTILAKRKIAMTVRAIFLIRGHTKNDCDRMFNLLKLEYRKTNLYAPEELYEALGKHELVTAKPVKEGDFKKWDEFQEIHMKRPRGIQLMHMFKAKADESDFLFTQACEGKAESRERIVKTGNSFSWETMSEPPPIPEPGIQFIKWIELFDKWGPLLHPEKRLLFKYFHEDPGLGVRNDVKENTKKAKESRQGRSRSTRAQNDTPEP